MRYFFELADGDRYPDDEGAELPDVSAACLEASKVLGDFLRERPAEFWRHDCLQVNVSDETGLRLFALNLSVSLSPAMHGGHPPVK